MTTQLTEVQQELQAVCREFAAKEIRPLAAHFDEADHEVPYELWRKGAEIGLNGFMLPEAYGGGGMDDCLTHCIVTEELCHGDAALGHLLTSAGFFAETVIALGTDEQKARWITPLADTQNPPFTALATTEPEAGSDAAAIATHAKRVDGGYLLNGAKTWISNGNIAQYYIVFATVEPGTRSKGITAFVCERGDEGLSWGEPMDKMGQRAIPTTELFLNDVQLPEDRRIGAEGQGFYGLMETFDRSRVTLASGSLGIARAALEYAVEYAKERKTWGKPIKDYQAVSFRLADADLKVEQARLLTHHAARRLDAGLPATREAAMAKLAAAEAAVYTTWAAIQTLGGYGYSREYPVEKWYRDARLDEIWEGTSDIMRLIIGRELFA